MMDTMYYFAYGSNLHLERMLARCPKAKPVCKATLRFWRLTYRANFSGNGVATIVKNALRRGAVYGALYQVTEEDLKILDRYEGTPNTYYRRMVTVETPFGQRKAVTYVMQDYFEPEKPNPSYLNIIQKGYRQWRLPLEKLNIAPSNEEYRRNRKATCFTFK